MTFVDILLLLIVIVSFFFGFFKGLIKISIAIVALYASIIISSLYFRFLAAKIGSEAAPQLAQMVSFFIILLVAFFILYFSGAYTFRYAKLTGRLQYLDKMIGTFLGLVLGAMFASIVAMIFQYLFITNNTQAQIDFPFVEGLAGSSKRSALIPIFLRVVLPIIYTPISPLLPDAADRIFRSLQ
ncbi:MAG TPA: CvpA family protein [Herpetosiphonaceae bacterium]